VSLMLDKIMELGAPSDPAYQRQFELMQGAVAFDITAAAEYFFMGNDRDEWKPDAFPSVTAPFSACWLEYVMPAYCRANGKTTPLRKPSGAKRTGYLVVMDELRGSGWASYLARVTPPSGKKNPWAKVSTSGSASKSLVHFDTPAGRITDEIKPKWGLTIAEYLMTEDDRLVMGGGYNIIPLREDGSIVSDGFCRLFDTAQPIPAPMFSPALFALSLLNTVNREVVERIPDAKLQKARERRGKLPLLKFSEIIVPGFGKSKSALHGTKGEHRDLSLHVVRGHFKRRATGVYWWHPHLRGKYENGVTLSSYKISDAPSPTADN
jgi:hypothetical protein